MDLFSAKIMTIMNTTYSTGIYRNVAIEGSGGIPRVDVTKYANVDLDLTQVQLDIQFIDEVVTLMGKSYIRVFLDGVEATQSDIAGLIYTTTDNVVGVTVKDDDAIIKTAVTSLNFKGSDVLVVDPGVNGEVDIYIPPVAFSPHLGSSTGVINWPGTDLGFISRPHTAPGAPYFTNGWDNNTNNHPKIKDVSSFSSGLGLSHTSQRVTDLHLGQIDLIVTDGNGNTDSAVLFLASGGGDQNAIGVHNTCSIHVRDTIDVGGVVEGKVYIKVDWTQFLMLNSTGQGGYVKIEVNHTAAPSTADFGDAFWDAGSAPSGSTPPEITVNTAVLRYLSGVPYYTTGTIFDIVDSPLGVTNIVNSTIDQDKDIISVNFSDFNSFSGEIDYDASEITGLNWTASLSPVMLDKSTYSDSFEVGGGNFRNLNPVAYTNWHNYHGSEGQQSSVGIFAIDTFGITSTPSTRYFDDEAYRLQDESVNDFNQTLTDYRQWVGTASPDLRDWDSMENINSGTSGHQPGLQIGSGVLQYPIVDYSSGRLPVGPNYSGISGDRYEYDGFWVGDTLTHKNFIITLSVNNIDTSDIDIGLGGDDSKPIRLDIKFPGPMKTPMNGANSGAEPGSGWLHCGKQYNSGDFVGNDGNGCVSSITKVGSIITINITTENLSTEYCDGILITRIKFADGIASNKTITSLSVTGV